MRVKYPAALQRYKFDAPLLAAGTLTVYCAGYLRESIRLLSYKKAFPIFVTVFSSCSSGATIPASMDVATKNFECDETVASHGIPLGATVNKDGVAILCKVVLLFSAQAMGIPMTAAQIRKDRIGIGSSIYARKPGDGSAREQAASCQKVLGGMADLTISYAARRYRANLINWGILPFELTDIGDLDKFQKGSYLFLSDIKKKIENGEEGMDAYILDRGLYCAGALKLRILEIFSTCTVGCSKESPTDSSIRKNRANALLRLLTQPLFAHS